MSEKAKELLYKMASAYENSKQNSFDSFFYSSYHNDVLVELENNGYINIKDDIIGSIELTDNGYAEARN